jgi:hypothetical protein
MPEGIHTLVDDDPRAKETRRVIGARFKMQVAELDGRCGKWLARSSKIGKCGTLDGEMMGGQFNCVEVVEKNKGREIQTDGRAGCPDGVRDSENIHIF